MISRVLAPLIAANVSIAVVLAWMAPAAAAESEDDVVVLVAKRQFHDPLYGSSVVVAKPLGEGRHVGFILNKPTNMKLGQVFPGHAPSQKIVDPLFLGGPSDMNVVFALVQRSSSPGKGSLQIIKDVFLAISGETVDGIIESGEDHARFFVGAVVWRPGELDEELKRGIWYVQDADADIVLREDTERLWEDLVRFSEDRANAI